MADPRQLSKRERQIMDAVYARGGGDGLAGAGGHPRPADARRAADAAAHPGAEGAPDPPQAGPGVRLPPDAGPRAGGAVGAWGGCWTCSSAGRWSTPSPPT